ncbi:MAG: branched-chain amino acid transaminase [Cyanobacteria bacterium SZAS LIN-5]|nr:branched-chain amino acid transaminase [Cyanobacteria bacterium SZAS LIN-5]
METDNKSLAYFKGNFVPIEEANINIMNHSFMYGTAVFEGIRAYWNAKQEELFIFRLREHFERMKDSMKIMYLEPKYSVDELCNIVVELLKRNAPTTDTYIRPAAYKTAHRVGPSLDNNPSDVCMFTVPFGDYFHGAEGLKVQISSWRRVEDNAIPARAKIVGAYANTALAKTDAVMAGFDECIVLSENGHVSEGSAMNLFMVKRGQLITTPTTENILEGITRSSIMELAEQELGLKTVSRTVDRSELYTADELFFCGTGAQIAPIIEVDKRKIGDGKSGSISNQIKDTYISICRGENEKYHKWLTPVHGKATSKSAAKEKAASKL